MKSVRTNKMFFRPVFFIFIASLSAYTACGSKPNTSNIEPEWPLASPENPPPGKYTTVHKANVRLGQYKTCDGYAKLLTSKMSFFEKGFMVFAKLLQDMSTVKCKNDHTCYCNKDQYFTENMGGKLKQPLYRCIEASSAGIESAEIYQANKNFPKEGVIKIALPQSYCNSKIQ